MGRGPMLLHLPMRLLLTIRQRAGPAIQAANCSSSSSSKPANLQGAAATSGGADSSAGGAVVVERLLLALHNCQWVHYRQGAQHRTMHLVSHLTGASPPACCCCSIMLLL